MNTPEFQQMANLSRERKGILQAYDAIALLLEAKNAEIKALSDVIKRQHRENKAQIALASTEALGLGE